MKTTHTLIALGLLALSGSAQAATWTLGASSQFGQRAGSVGFAGQAASTEYGNITDDLNDVSPAYVAVGSWRSFTATGDGNAIDASLSHEGYVQPGVIPPGFPLPGVNPANVVTVHIMTSAVLDNAQINGDTSLAAELGALAHMTQSFVITPEAGEAIGMPVWVDYLAGYAHEAEHGNGFRSFMASSFGLWLNGVWVDAAGISGVGDGFFHGPLGFQAHIGDTLTVELFNLSRLETMEPLALVAGDLPEARVFAEAGFGLVLSPVPEAETWAMLLMGLGLVGLQIRRKTPINAKVEF